MLPFGDGTLLDDGTALTAEPFALKNSRIGPWLLGATALQSLCFITFAPCAVKRRDFGSVMLKARALRASGLPFRLTETTLNSSRGIARLPTDGNMPASS
jgi:hypothetical protein